MEKKKVYRLFNNKSIFFYNENINYEIKIDKKVISRNKK